MKTIAISIDESMLARLRRLATESPPGEERTSGRIHRRSVSELVRAALDEYLDRMDRSRREENDRRALARHRRTLQRQAVALLQEQAKP